MDRHDIPQGVTSEHVAEMHQEDLKVQHLYECKGMTYWCDEKRRTAFCLIEAPNKKALQNMHNHAHGDVPHTIVEVNADIVESFLGRIEDPEHINNKKPQIIDDSAFRFIMVIDLENNQFNNYTSTRQKLALKNFNESIVEIINDYDGRIVRRKSLCSLISFESVSNVVLCAIEIQSKFKGILDQDRKLFINLEIGLSAGNPITKDHALFEDTIKNAERLCKIAKGTIVVTSEIKEQYKSENLNAFVHNEFISTLSPSNEKFLNTLMDLTENTWNNSDMNVEKFSKQLGYSKSQLYRKMIFITGKSPNKFLKEYRLNRALNLLNKQNGNISEIAFETGFSSPAYFSKCFSDVYGILPSNYAKKSVSKS